MSPGAEDPIDRRHFGSSCQWGVRVAATSEPLSPGHASSPAARAYRRPAAGPRPCCNQAPLDLDRVGALVTVYDGVLSHNSLAII